MDNADLVPETSLSFMLELGLLISTLVGGFAIGTVRSAYKKLRKSNINWNVHTQLHEFLTELRVKTDAGRAQIVQFHNGEYFVDGVSMQKMSVTHESLANGVSAEATSKQNTLITLISPIMLRLEENLANIYRTDEEKPGNFKNCLEAANIDSYSVLPLFHGHIKSGFIMIQWCSKTKTQEIEKDLERILFEIHYYRNIIQAKLGQQLKV